jgi:hypothetical protein
MHELERLGKSVEPLLREVLQGKPSPEVKRRVERLLGQVKGPFVSGEMLRALRAVEVLEHMATPEARQLLEALARGTPEARLTQEAKASLARVK